MVASPTPSMGVVETNSWALVATARVLVAGSRVREGGYVGAGASANDGNVGGAGRFDRLGCDTR
jgi:hypothetical protein